LYDDSVIARRIASHERATSTTLREVDIPRVRDLVNYLEGRPDPRNPKRWIRPLLAPEFRAFIANERAMCKASFLYWARRYAYLNISGGDGGLHLFEPWETQYLLLRRIAERERHMWYRRDCGDPSYDGICFLIHKARQLGFTALCQLLLLHRALFYADMRTLAASLDDQKTQLMHARWSLAYSKLPWWLKPGIASQAYDRGKWLRNGSKMVLQDFSQLSGLGQGEQWDCWHMTELSAVPAPYFAEHVESHLLPTLTNSSRALGLMESQSQGWENQWREITELARKGEYGRWQYFFAPWYSATSNQKNARYDIPLGWSPDRDTLAHAKKIEATSPEWMGYAYSPTREQLYFYETERNRHRKSGQYATFLVQYCATPEESFQHSTGGAFNEEIIQLLRDEAEQIQPVAYELGTPQTSLANRREDHPVVTINNQTLIPVHMSPADRADPRGLVLIYDAPRRDLWYSVGGDPADGIPGWHRRFRSQDREELRKDNAALSIWFSDPKDQRSKQAAEFAGPITPREFALYCDILCRMYGGVYGRETGAPLILEIHPGPGGQTQARLQYELHFSHFFRWVVFNGAELKPTNSWGFYSSPKAVRELWIKGRELVEHRDFLPVKPRSQYLLNEMQSASWDPIAARGRAIGGMHDDRVSSALFALWQLHDWAVPKPQTRSYEPVQYAKPCLPGCQPPENHERACVNLPEDKWDWQERDITTLEQYDAAVDSWIERRMARG